MFSQNQKAFALAMIAFAMPASASQDEGCNAMYAGEIRSIYDNSLAWDQKWVDGFYRSDVSTGVSTNLSKKYCSNDSSIRNSENQCLTWMGQSTDIEMGTSECFANYQTCEAGNVNQEFTVDSTDFENDNMNNGQIQVAFKNTGNDSCLGQDGSICGDCALDKNMFRTNGTVLNEGNLENQSSGRCLIPVTNEHEAQVTTIECDDNDVNQQFTLYSTGEIRHDATGLCLGNNPFKVGIFSVSFCLVSQNQGFIRQAQTDSSFALVWMADEKMCVEEVSAQDGSAAPRACSQSEEQKWNFGTHDWSSPSFTWVQMGCGNGIETSYAYSEQLTFIDQDGIRSSAEDDLVDQAKEALRESTYIKNDVAVQSSDVSFLSQNYADMMYHPSDASIDRSHLFTCEGESTCMYRSVMTMTNNDLNSTLEWVTGYTRCMEAMPICVPLTKSEEGLCVADSEYAYSKQ